MKLLQYATIIVCMLINALTAFILPSTQVTKAFVSPKKIFSPIKSFIKNNALADDDQDSDSCLLPCTIVSSTCSSIRSLLDTDHVRETDSQTLKTSFVGLRRNVHSPRAVLTGLLLSSLLLLSNPIPASAYYNYYSKDVAIEINDALKSPTGFEASNIPQYPKYYRPFRVQEDTQGYSDNKLCYNLPVENELIDVFYPTSKVWPWGQRSRNLFTGEYPVLARATNVNRNICIFTAIPMDKKYAPIKEKSFFYERGQSSAAEKIEGKSSFYERGQTSAEK